MILTAEQIQKTISPLLHYGSPPARCLARRHILQTPADAEVIVDLWRDVQSCPAVTEILSRQDEHSSWFAGGSWAYRPGLADPHAARIALNMQD